MRKYLFILGCICLTFCGAFAQDPQYSQFYAAPLYLNPAFAGSALVPRATFNYRMQWPSIDARYNTFSASFDHYFSRYNSGVGLLITEDRQGVGGIRSTDIGAMYAYQLQLSEQVAVRAGLQLSYVMRSSNYFNLVFGDQFDPTTGGFTNPTGEPFNGGERIGYPSVSSGGLLFTDQLWVGLAVHHMNRPNQSFLGDVSRLPAKFSVHAGYKIPLNDETRRGLAQNINAPERSITPAILYKSQGRFNQLDVGLYATLEPMVFGLWYRGLPIIPNEFGINNHDAAIFLVGFTHEGWSIGYSYDLTVSNLGPATGGAHELSLTYLFPEPAPRRRLPRATRRIPCPKF
jgi:type IX secretion system PorP/SprF family membrane protein